MCELPSFRESGFALRQLLGACRSRRLFERRHRASIVRGAVSEVDLGRLERTVRQWLGCCTEPVSAVEIWYQDRDDYVEMNRSVKCSVSNLRDTKHIRSAVHSSYQFVPAITHLHNANEC
ncbi:hypothetical protein M3J09_003978 [Ascochyta lentis]